MRIGPIGVTELIIILIVVLVIFGPKNLPKLGKAVGRTVANLREGMDSGKKDKDDDDDDDDSKEDVAAVVVEDKDASSDKAE